jgi:O-antigen/teichoic acid export membrane protein
MLQRKMAVNAGVQLAAKAALLLLSMLTFALLTRHLGPEKYGRYSVVLSVVGMAGIVAELGLGTIAIRELAAQRESIDRIFPSLVFVRTALGGLGVVTAAGIGWGLGYDADLVRLISLYSLIFVIRGIGTGTYGLISSAALAAWKNMLADAAESLAFLTIVIIGMATSRRIGWFVSGTVASAAVGSAVIFALTHRSGPSVWRIDFRYCRHLMHEAAPLALAGLFTVIYFRIDALMLSKLSGEDAAGVYGAAYKYVESTSFISAVFLSSLFPVLAYCFEHDRAKFLSYYQQALDWAAACAFSLGLFLYVFAGELISLLNGDAFGGSVAVLRICCGAIVIMFVNSIGIHLLFAARQQHYLVWINLLAAVSKVAVNFVVIPRFGASGAAAATVSTEILITVSVFTVVHKLHGVSTPVAPLAKVGLVALAAVTAVELLHPSLAERALLLVGWAGALLLIGMPKPRQILKLLQSSEG